MRSRREVIFLIIQRFGVNYSAYTTLATPQHIDQIIYFKGFVRFFYLNLYCEYDYFFRISFITNVANSKT